MATILKNFSSEHNLKLFVVGLFFLIGGFPLSFIIIILVQEAIFHPNTYLIFSTPITSNIIFSLSLVILTIGLALIINYTSKLIKSIGALVILLSTVLLLLSFYNYTSFDKDGLHINRWVTFNEQFYPWESVENVTQLNKNGHPSKIEFTFENDKVYIYSIDSKWFSKRHEFTQLLRNNNINFNYRDLE
ncbi:MULTISPECIES: EbsA family protein [Cytobacillus]|uniref:EbsA family protein n=1 Tax=Cytobacillus TaxID=2675230 RepID=UPI00203F8C4C|nr:MULTISPECIES: EbsA family protein [Cytobacillus]MCM3094368.1 hypothetical protein [Cytobacillus sp. AMY 15.2]MCM3707883.1 hypothetical protein [Cytobacillus firmus]